jgi:hypothetical protein
MIAATMMSGHPVPVPNTPIAASNTARFPRTSFRVQIQAERILALTRTVSLWEHPWRDRQTGARDAGRPAARQTCTTINVRQMVFQQAALAGEAAAAVG